MRFLPSVARGVGAGLAACAAPVGLPASDRSNLWGELGRVDLVSGAVTRVDLEVGVGLPEEVNDATT